MFGSLSDVFYDACEFANAILDIAARSAVTLLAALPIGGVIFGAYEIISLVIESGPKI